MTLQTMMRGTAVRAWRRLLPVLIVLGVLGLHHVIAAPAEHGAVTGTSTGVSQTAADPTAVGSDTNDGSGTAAECGGLVLLCMAMLAGVGAFLVLRGRSHRPWLWMGRVRTSSSPPAWRPPVMADPRERIGLLRC